MAVEIIDREVKKGDPIESQNLRLLMARITEAAKKKGTLDELLIFRHQGAAGMVDLGKGTTIGKDPTEADIEKAAKLLLSMIDSHAEEEGCVLYQIRGFGTTGGGQATEKMRFAYRPGSDTEQTTEAGSEMMDVVKASRLANESMAKSVEALTSMNEAIAKNFGEMTAQVVGMLDVASRQGMTMVEAKRLEVDAKKWEIEMQQQEREAEREANLSAKRMEHGVTVLGWVADGFLANQANKGGVKVEKGAASSMALEEIFKSLTDDEKAAARAAVGEEIMDLFLAAVEKKNPAERRGILREILRRFKGMDDGRRTQIGVALANAIGQNRAMGIMAAVRAGAA